jgi:hypothetical protein
VSRRKKGEEPKERATFTVSPEFVRALQLASDESGIPMSRIVERAVWDHLPGRHKGALLALLNENLGRDLDERERALDKRIRQSLNMRLYDYDNHQEVEPPLRSPSE